MVKKLVILNLGLSFFFHSVDAFASDPAVSLESDKKAIEDMRKDIPTEIKQSNDDLAAILKLFDDKKINPTSVRSRFEDLVGRKRRDLQKIFQGKRDQFNQSSKLEREKFMQDQKVKRDEMFKKTKDSQERKTFIDQQTVEREAFFRDLQGRRQANDDDLLAERKFEEEKIRDMKKNFDENYKIYERDYNQRHEIEKAMRHKKPIPNINLSPENEALIQEFDKIPKTKGEKIGPE